MGETLYRKSWQPLVEADKSGFQLAKYGPDSDFVFTTYYAHDKEKWCVGYRILTDLEIKDCVFLHLEPVEEGKLWE